MEATPSRGVDLSNLGYHTIMAWVLFDANPVSSTDWFTTHSWSTSTASIILRASSSAVQGFHIQEANSQQGGNFVSLSAVGDGLWHLRVFRLDNGISNMFEDTTKSATTYGSSGQTMDANANANALRSRRSNAMDGSLAYWVVWNVALTDNEINALARGVHPIAFRDGSTLLRMYPLTGSYGSNTDPDWSRNGGLITDDAAGKRSDNPAMELIENYL